MSALVDTSQLDTFIARLGSWSSVSQGSLTEALEQSTTMLQETGQEGAPEWQGELRGSIGHSVAYPQGAAGPKAPYAPFVHGYFGAAGRTRPHFPPLAAIAGWAEAHGIPAGALAHGIAQRGTPLVPFMTKAKDARLSDIKDAFGNAVKRAVGALFGGG